MSDSDLSRFIKKVIDTNRFLQQTIRSLKDDLTQINRKYARIERDNDDLQKDVSFILNFVGDKNPEQYSEEKSNFSKELQRYTDWKYSRNRDDPRRERTYSYQSGRRYRYEEYRKSSSIGSDIDSRHNWRGGSRNRQRRPGTGWKWRDLDNEHNNPINVKRLSSDWDHEKESAGSLSPKITQSERTIDKRDRPIRHSSKKRKSTDTGDELSKRRVLSDEEVATGVEVPKENKPVAVPIVEDLRTFNLNIVESLDIETVSGYVSSGNENVLYIMEGDNIGAEVILNDSLNADINTELSYQTFVSPRKYNINLSCAEIRTNSEVKDDTLIKITETDQPVETDCTSDPQSLLIIEENTDVRTEDVPCVNIDTKNVDDKEVLPLEESKSAETGKETCNDVSLTEVNVRKSVEAVPVVISPSQSKIVVTSKQIDSNTMSVTVRRRRNKIVKG